MTDHTFDTPAADEPAKRRNLVIAGGAAGLLVLGGAGFLLLSGGSSDVTANVASPLPKAPQVAKNATIQKKPSAAAIKLPAATSVQVGRDPFLALYLAPAAAAAGTATTGTTTPETTTAGATTTGSTSGIGTTSPSTPAVPTTYRLALLKVTGTGASRTAAFSVAGKTQYARVGSVFGRSSEVKLLSFQQSAKGVWSVTIQVGDDAPKDMSLNEVISVL
jgi:hypothetical protein